MALVGRYERMSAAAGLRAGHDQRGRRPARAAARGGPGAGRDDRPELARRRWPPPSGRCGARWSWASPTPAGPAPSELVVDVGPPRPGRGPARPSPRSASREWQPPAWDARDPRRPAVRPRGRGDRPAPVVHAGGVDALAGRACATGPTTIAGRARRRRRRRRRTPVGVHAAQRRRRWSPRCSACGGPARVYVPLNPRLTDRATESPARRRGHRTGRPRRGRSSRPAGRLEATRRRDRRHVRRRRRAGVSSRRAPPGAPKPVLLAPLGRARRCSTASSASSGREPASTGAGQRRRADAEPDPGVAVAVGRHLQRAVRPARRRAGRGHGRLRHRRVRRARRGATASAHGAAAGGDGRCSSTTSASTDLAPLRYVRSITAPLSPCQARRFRDRFGIAVLNGYGQTEIGGEIVGWSARRLAGVRRGQARLGRPPPRRASSVRVDDAGPTSRRAVGPHAGHGAGYADGADLADRLTADGWFRTGDIARIDDDGFVWIEGRVSRHDQPGRAEGLPRPRSRRCCGSSPGVADVAVVGVPDDRLGEVPWAFVVAAAGAAAVDPTLCRATAAPTWRRTRCRCGSSRSTRCPATRSARS